MHHPMKKITLILLVAGSMAAVSCKPSSQKTESTQTQSFSLDTTQLKAGDVYYQCSMDTEVLSDLPGSCPNCGMDLTKKTKQ